MLKKFNRKEEGISALEYALIAFLIALAIVIGAGALGTNMNTTFQDSADALTESTTP